MNLKIIVLSLTAGILLFGGYLFYSSLDLATHPLIDSDQCLARGGEIVTDKSYTTLRSNPGYIADVTGDGCPCACIKKETISGEIEQLDISTWKTYRNEKYGFEVKYPSELSIFTPDAAQRAADFTIKPPDQIMRGEGGVGIFLEVIDESSQPIIVWCKNSSQIAWIPGVKDGVCMHLFPMSTLAGETIEEFTLGETRIHVINARSKSYYFQKGGYIFSITDVYFNQTESTEEFTKMFFTFKFIK